MSPHNMFSWRNKKIIMWIPFLSTAMETPKTITGKNAHSDQMQLNAESNQGLHCLQIVWPFFSTNIYLNHIA